MEASGLQLARAEGKKEASPHCENVETNTQYSSTNLSSDESDYLDGARGNVLPTGKYGRNMNGYRRECKFIYEIRTRSLL